MLKGASDADPSNHADKKAQRALYLAKALEGIARLSRQDLYRKLEEWAARETGRRPSLTLRAGEHFKTARDPNFWCACFVRLFHAETARKRATTV